MADDLNNDQACSNRLVELEHTVSAVREYLADLDLARLSDQERSKLDQVLHTIIHYRSDVTDAEAELIIKYARDHLYMILS